MQKKVLITGISGFAGSHLAEYLVSKKKYAVSGTYLLDSGLEHLFKFKNEITLSKIDLTDAVKVSQLIKITKPDYIFHLAALTSPANSFNHPAETIINNVTAQINLLEAIKNYGFFNTSILIVSSADIYGKVAEKDLPIDEETKFNPANPYSVSKITQDFLGLQYFLSYNLKIIRVRPFNHIGPRQSPNFAVASFAKKIAEIEKGKINNILHVGNLDAKRDFTDVRDMVCAYALILEKGKIGDVYNMGSGVAYKMSEILERLLFFSKMKIKIEVDPVLLRPSDEPVLLCDNRKIKKVTGWNSKISLDQTLKDTLDYWRSIV